MIRIDSLKQGVLAMVGALILTGTTVGAAVGPAHAVETGPVAAPQAGGLQA
jgi:hypothetical protein